MKAIPEAFNRIDQAYQWFLDAMFIEKMHSKIIPESGPFGYPVNNAETTKELVFSCVKNDDLSRLLPRLSFPLKMENESIIYELDNDFEEKMHKLGIYSRCTEKEIFLDAMEGALFLPYMLGKWTMESRRIYNLPLDLSLLLKATSFKGFTYNDLYFPFNTFAITLEEPLLDENKNAWDCILVEDFKCGKGSIYLLSKELQTRKPLAQNSKQKLINLLTRRKSPKNTLKALKEYEKINKDRMSKKYVTYFGGSKLNDYELGIDIESDIKNDSKYIDSLVDDTLRLVIGFVLYLKTFSDRNITNCIQSKEKLTAEVKHPVNHRSFIDKDKIFQVESIYKLSTEEQNILKMPRTGKNGYEVNPHFREGHWRRPPNTVNNPNQEKTIWVRPCIVNKEKLGKDELPSSTGKIL